MSMRSGSAKKGVNTQASRSRRESVTLSIRKEKREGGLAKRRMMGSSSALSNTESGGTETESIGNSLESASTDGTAKKPIFTVSDFPTMVQELKSSDSNIQLLNLRGFRRLLSAERNPPVQECIDCGAISLFV